ncbi:MAG TPA: hypothetical protein VFO58_16345 [Vicinamibacterales bacterium]|nr:hypothetical protein [Vicinamibacterales bacterium]
MRKRQAAFVVLYLAFAAGTADAQECLHGPTETAEQAARRFQALAATRAVNTMQANEAGLRGGLYMRHEELANSAAASRMRESTNATMKRISLIPGTDILPDWELTLDVTERGYWFMIKDKVDPCGFAFVSNQVGLIFNAEPIR